MEYKLHNISKQKSNIIGYWKEKDKVYIDNIKICQYANIQAFKIAKKALFNSGELAVFYTIKNIGYIEDKKGNITKLNNRIEYKYKKSYDNIEKIRDIINQYGGCTVYKEKNNIIIEVFTKE